MKITKNTSLYETKKLKSLFCFIHNQLAKHEGRMPWWDDLNIHIQDKTTSKFSGRAFLRFPRYKPWGMFLSMSKDCSLYQVAQLFAHELMHNYGYNHNQFNSDPLDRDQIAEIMGKFEQKDLLKPEAFIVKPPRKPRVIRDWEERTMELMAQYSWLSFYEKEGYYGADLEIEIFDERLDFEHFYEHWMYEYTDKTTSWYKAYNLAKKLIKGDIQKELTENWTVGLNELWFKEHPEAVKGDQSESPRYTKKILGGK
jgi:hypothetical protein